MSSTQHAPPPPPAPPRPLQWRYILLSALVAAVLSVPVAYGLVALGEAIGGALFPLCDRWPGDDLGSIMVCAVAYYFGLVFLLLVLYLGLSTSIVLFLTNLWVRDRRVAHAALAMVLFVPLAVLLLGLSGLILRVLQ